MDLFPLAPVVPINWLAERLGRPGLVILDTSWYLPNSGRSARDEYRMGHIPGAGFFDLDAASDLQSPLPHTLPEADEFGRYVGALGVGNEITVVVYDGSGGNLSAARAWWMFRAFGHDRVCLLDGGLGRWRVGGRPLETGVNQLPPQHFRARLDRSRLRGLAEVRTALERGDAQVVDMRSAGRFEGRDPEPRPGIPSGHMPGALSLPYTDLVRPDGTVLPDEVLKTRIRDAGIRLDRPVIATCGSGTSACNLLLALDRLGHRDHALYDGSWTEWVSRGMPVAKEP